MTHHEHDEVPMATFLDAEDTKDFEPEPELGPEHEQVTAADPQDRVSPENIGENLKKVAAEAAFAAVGFAGFVGDKAKTFYEEQQRQYVAAHPDNDSTEGAKAFLAQMRDQINKFVEELTKGYREMADRGRGEARHGAEDEEQDGPEVPGPPAS
ncbi:hypothetical protein [Tessaracoccus sp. Z1128]